MRYLLASASAFALLATSVNASPLPQLQVGCTAGQYACGPLNELGQGTIVICQGDAFVKLDNCEDGPNNACQLIGGVPYCVAGTGASGMIGGGAAPAAPAAPNKGATTPAPAPPAPAAPAPAPAPAPAAGGACATGALRCGALNAEGQGTIDICQGGAFTLLDKCEDDPNNACKLINNIPFCVAGTGASGTFI
ncbi:hypothetical protein HK101_004287, partial [Irineochytrium annulatum]